MPCKLLQDGLLRQAACQSCNFQSVLQGLGRCSHIRPAFISQALTHQMYVKLLCAVTEQTTSRLCTSPRQERKTGKTRKARCQRNHMATTVRASQLELHCPELQKLEHHLIQWHVEPLQILLQADAVPPTQKPAFGCVHLKP